MTLQWQRWGRTDQGRGADRARPICDTRVVAAEQQAATLNEGALILGEVLAPSGFIFTPGARGNSSGGPAAQGRFVRETQTIDLHFRWSLGLVSYTWDDVVVSHADYLRGLSAQGAYPGFSEDPLDGFRHLTQDLSGPLIGFVEGNCAEFDQVVAAVKVMPTTWLP